MNKVIGLILFSIFIASPLFAQTQPVTISSVLSQLQLRQSVGYDIAGRNAVSCTTADLFDYKGFSLSGGYSTSNKIIGTIDYDLGGLSKLGINSPLLSIIDLRVGMFVGVGQIAVSKSDGNNMIAWGPEVTVINVKF